MSNSNNKRIAALNKEFAKAKSDVADDCRTIRKLKQEASRLEGMVRLNVDRMEAIEQELAGIK